MLRNDSSKHPFHGAVQLTPFGCLAVMGRFVHDAMTIDDPLPLLHCRFCVSTRPACHTDTWGRGYGWCGGTSAAAVVIDSLVCSVYHSGSQADAQQI